METIFSKIIRKEIPADIVYEDDYLIAFKDIEPVAPIHILIVPKKEISTVNDLTKEDEVLIGKVYLLVKKLAEDYKVSEDGYRVVTNCNDFGGQTVFQLHFHFISGEKLGTMV